MEGPESTGAEYAKSVQDVLAHAAEVDKAAGHRTSPRKASAASGPVLGVVALIFAAVVYYNVRLFTAEPAPLTPQQAEMSSGISLMIATQAVEAYRTEHGRLPESLEELGFPAGSMAYRVSGDEYELGASQGVGDTLTSSSEDGPMQILEEMGITLGEVPSLPDEAIR